MKWLIRILTFVSALAGMMSMFLPFGKIMYYHPESFSIISLTKYNVKVRICCVSTKKSRPHPRSAFLLLYLDLGLKGEQAKTATAVLRSE